MRWWIYQKERFPIFANGLLIAAFSSCAVFYSSFLSGGSPPNIGMFAVAFVTCFIFFLQLRIADEFKDAGEDAQFRPYRPVPRGLIKLRELGIIFVIGALIQLALALWFSPKLLWILLFGWIYLSLMSAEFFCRDWLKARPMTYLWTHMLIMPIFTRQHVIGSPISAPRRKDSFGFLQQASPTVSSLSSVARSAFLIRKKKVSPLTANSGEHIEPHGFGWDASRRLFSLPLSPPAK
jgi:4-hydroxybenzoate polyprenyltransferase